MPPGIILKLYLDRLGRLWLGTDRSGASRIDDAAADRLRFVTYASAEGLSGTQIWCFTEDESGRIYIGTGRGVFRLNPATGRVKHYTTTDGLSYNTVRAAFCDRRGWLWFGTLKGMSRLIPEPDRPGVPSPVWISGLSIAGRPHPVSELGSTEIAGPALAASQNQIQIDFFGLSFSIGETLRYQYKPGDVDRYTHGLPSMQERAKNLGGTLEVISQRGQGTTVILRVPVASRRPAPWRRFLPE